MQILPVYLYPNIYNVILDLDPLVTGVNQTMYQHDLKLQRGVRNSVRIQFKNSDQKRISVATTGSYTFNMFDISTQQLVVQKTLDILENSTSTRGLAQLTLAEGDTINLNKSSYNFSITYQDPATGEMNPTYANTYYGMMGVAYLDNAAYPMLKPSQQISSFLPVFNDEEQQYEFISGDIYAYPELNNNDALHTAVVYLTNYRGKFQILGTLSNSPVLSDYTIIEEQTFSNSTGPFPQNFNGIYTYVKFKFIPDVAPGESVNNNPEYYGEFDKVLYRS
jgi:hypothetical protein